MLEHMACPVSNSSHKNNINILPWVQVELMCLQDIIPLFLSEFPEYSVEYYDLQQGSLLSTNEIYVITIRSSWIVLSR